MKYVYVLAIFCGVLFGTHLYSYKTGYIAGGNSVRSELSGLTQKQEKAIAEANKKILDFQVVIGNNTDECFNRVWPNEIIESVNPSLLR